MLLSFLNWGIRSIKVKRKVRTSAIGNANHTPSSWKNCGNINRSGIKNRADLDIEVINDWRAFPIDWKTSEPTIIKPIKYKNRKIRFPAYEPRTISSLSVVKIRMNSSV